MRMVDSKKKARSILGVADDADMNMIRHTYRKLAKKYHPDRNLDDKSVEGKFILITEAYKILCGKKNTGRYIANAYSNCEHEPPFDGKSYWEWWLERYKDLI